MQANAATALNIPICERCGSRIQPERKGDFFGYCSWECLNEIKSDFEANIGNASVNERDNTPNYELTRPSSGLFGKRSLL